MTALPRVAEQTRERVAREFDDLGPDACMAEIFEVLRKENPELLDMATKCARDSGDASKIMIGFGMFYRLLVVQSGASGGSPVDDGAMRLARLPRVTPDTRDAIVRRIDELGTEAFTRSSLEELEHDNPELLQMAHNFALRHPDYLRIMQGFALLYASLSAQAAADRTTMH